MVTLSSEGHLQCSYMGTDPSFFTAPKVEAREVNYEEVDTEMRTLQKIIRETTKTQGEAGRLAAEMQLGVSQSLQSGGHFSQAQVSAVDCKLQRCG